MFHFDRAPSVLIRERGRQNELIHFTSFLNYDDMTACGLLGICITRKVLGLLQKFDVTQKANKMIA